MENRLLLGINRHTLPIPKSLWQRMLRPAVDLGFMSPDHHRVRNFVVIEIPRLGKPLSAEYLSQQLDIPIDRVTSILGELEKRMTFLYRNEHGEVAWAYPITAEKTPHHMTFSTGERIDAA